MTAKFLAKAGTAICGLCLTLIFTSPANAANWFVRPSGGTGSGTSWTAAWNGFSAISWTSVACGDTVWVAGGTYTQDLIPTRYGCTAGAQIYIRRARSDATAATSAAGWSPAFDSMVYMDRAGIQFAGDNDYYTISGRTTAAGADCPIGSNTACSTYGWHIDFSNNTSSGVAIEFTNGADTDNNTFEYMNLQGSGFVTYTGDSRGIDATPFSGATNNTFSHMKIWGWGAGAYNVGINSSIYEYIEMFDNDAANRAVHHPNGIYIADSSDSIVRYSVFRKGAYATSGEGIFWEQSGGCSNWQIYGNLFYDHNWDSGVKALNIASVVPGLKIFNNTFANNLNAINISNGGCTGTGVEMRNNFFYNSSTGTCGTSSNNITTSTVNPFVNLAGKDFHIISTIAANYPRNAGTNLSATFSLDRDRVLFGGDGTWDIGAYEYAASAPDTTPPSTPTNPSATTINAVQIDLSWTASTDNIGIAGYNIERCSGAGCSNWVEVQVTNGTGTTWSNTGLTASTLYRYRIRARDTASPANYSAAYSTIVQATTNAPTQYTVSPSKAIGASHGSIAPNTAQSVTEGNTTQFSIVPDATYQAFVGGTCGGSLVGTTYTTNAITASCGIEANFIPSVCSVLNTAGTPSSTSMLTQTGSFTYRFSLIPVATTHDLVGGHTNGTWAAYTSYATGVLFGPNGTVTVRNGGAYAALTTFNYVANAQYNVRMLVNVASHTYSVWIAPDGGNETQLAANYAFRTDQSSVSQLNSFTFISSTGTTTGAYVCPIGIVSSGPPDAPTNYRLIERGRQWFSWMEH